MGKAKLLALRRSNGNVHLESVHDVPETTETYQLCSLFNLLQDCDPFLYTITDLNISHCELTEVPKSLKLLKLRSLDLSHNKLTNPPSCLYGNGLSTLESLDLSFNELVQFEIEPDCAKTLKVLVLSSNKLNNIPPWFLTFQCHRLEEINYSDNKAEHYDFLKLNCTRDFAKMRLKKLILVSACLINADLTWIRCIRNITYLDISNDQSQSRIHVNRLPKIDILFTKPQWHAIEVLRLNNLSIQMFPEDISWLVTLKELHLSKNQIVWISDVLTYLDNLEVLDLSFNELVMLPKFPSSLKVLIASSNRIDLYPKISKNLEVLDLYDNYIRSVDLIREDLLIDLDMNYVSKEEIPDYQIYCKNRDTLRSKLNAKDRYGLSKWSESLKSTDELSGCESRSSESNLSSSLDDGKFSDTLAITHTNSYEEDWDKEYERFPKHPDISKSDDEFEANEVRRRIIPRKRNGMFWNVIDVDEDWIFVDAD